MLWVGWERQGKTRLLPECLLYVVVATAERVAGKHDYLEKLLGANVSNLEKLHYMEDNGHEKLHVLEGGSGQPCSSAR